MRKIVPCKVCGEVPKFTTDNYDGYRMFMLKDKHIKEEDTPRRRQRDQCIAEWNNMQK